MQSDVKRINKRRRVRKGKYGGGRGEGDRKLVKNIGTPRWLVIRASKKMETYDEQNLRLKNTCSAFSCQSTAALGEAAGPRLSFMLNISWERKRQIRINT